MQLLLIIGVLAIQSAAFIIGGRDGSMCYGGAIVKTGRVFEYGVLCQWCYVLSFMASDQQV